MLNMYRMYCLDDYLVMIFTQYIDIDDFVVFLGICSEQKQNILEKERKKKEIDIMLYLIETSQLISV